MPQPRLWPIWLGLGTDIVFLINLIVGTDIFIQQKADKEFKIFELVLLIFFWLSQVIGILKFLWAVYLSFSWKLCFLIVESDVGPQNHDSNCFVFPNKYVVGVCCWNHIISYHFYSFNPR